MKKGIVLLIIVGFLFMATGIVGSVLIQNSLEDMVQSTENEEYEVSGGTGRGRQGMGRQYFRNNEDCPYYN